MACGCGGGCWEPRWFFFQTWWLCSVELLCRSMVLLLLRVCLFFPALFLLFFLLSFSSIFSVFLLISLPNPPLFRFLYFFVLPSTPPCSVAFPPSLSLSLSLSFFLLLFPLLSLLSLGFFFFIYIYIYIYIYICSSLFSFSQYHYVFPFFLSVSLIFVFFNPPSIRPPLISFFFPPIYRRPGDREELPCLCPILETR